MKTCSRAIGTFLILAGAAFGFAQKQPQKDPYAAQLGKLQQAFYADMNRFYKPLQDAKTDQERMIAQKSLDPKKSPAKTYLPKFQKLAIQAGSNDSAFDAYNLAFECGMQMGDKKAEISAMDAMVNKFTDSPKMGELTNMLGYLPQQMTGPGDQARIDGWKAKLAKSKNPAVLSAFAFQDAQAAYADGQGDMKKSKELFQVVVSKYPKTQYAEQAKGQIYEIDHLSIGMPAPDFTASDQDGVEFKLSDYRGKVVLLDFWGFW